MVFRLQGLRTRVEGLQVRFWGVEGFSRTIEATCNFLKIIEGPPSHVAASPIATVIIRSSTSTTLHIMFDVLCHVILHYWENAPNPLGPKP